MRTGLATGICTRVGRIQSCDELLTLRAAFSVGLPVFGGSTRFVPGRVREATDDIDEEVLMTGES